MHKCSRCGRRFENPKALKMHVKDRHRGYHFAKYIMPYFMLFLIAGLLVVAASPYLATPRITQTENDKERLLNIYLTGHERLAMHIHARLKIVIDGVEVKIPANIGIADDGRMRVIHTHDETGVIHIESPEPAAFTFGDFLTIWGKKLTDECFDIYCGVIRFTVNGVEVLDPLSYVFRDRDTLVLEISTNAA